MGIKDGGEGLRQAELGSILEGIEIFLQDILSHLWLLSEAS